MRVVHVCKMTGAAGTENHLLALLPQLRGRGLDPHLIVLVDPTKPMDTYIQEMQSQRVPTEAMPIRSNVDRPLIGQLAARFRALGAEAVHTHLIHADWHGVLAARQAKIKQIYWSGHNDDPFRRRPAIRLMQVYLWRRITAGIAISEAVRQFMIRVELAPPKRVHTVHYGLTPRIFPTHSRTTLRQSFRISDTAPVIGSVCRLIDQKGLSYALVAFKQVLETHPDAHYIIVGDGPLRETLKQQTIALGINNRVHFAGWRADAAALMPAFDIFLMPSLWEGFGLVVLEAMAARLPVLASRVSALPELVADGVTGVLVPAADAASIASALKIMLSDADWMTRLGQSGRQRLEQDFSVDRMVDQTITVYKGYKG
jgi:glycosyltransferase involved in cell wall biosynthesis